MKEGTSIEPPPTDLPDDRAFALAAACAIATDEELGRAAPRLTGGMFDWDRFLELVHYHLIASLALVRLRSAAPGILPAAVDAELARTHLRDAARHALHLRETIDVTRVLAQGGIASIALKGAAIAYQLYPGLPECRTTSDIDVLVAEDDFARADACLVAHGYERTAPTTFPIARAQPMFFHLENVVTYLSPGQGQVIELHRRLTGNPHVFPQSFAELQIAGVRIETPDGPLTGLGDRVLPDYLAWHAVTAIDCRFKWFADVARAPAGQSRASGFALAILDSLRMQFGSGHETAGDSPWSHDARGMIAAMRSCAVTQNRRSLARIPEELAYTTLHARLADDPRAARYFAVRLLADPRDALVLRLGPRFAPLYAMAGPFLAIWRRLSRRGDASGEHVE